MRKVLRILLILVLVAIALLSLPYIRYRRTAGIVPAWVRIGGLEVHGATESEAILSLTKGLDEPLELFHGDKRLVLRPETVGFQVDSYAMLKEAQALDLPNHLVRYLVEASLERSPRTLEIPLRFSYNDAALEAWLDETIAANDRAAGAPIPVLESLTLTPGKPGLTTDRAGAKTAILAALANASNRTVRLPVAEFRPTFRGRVVATAPPLDPARVRQVGLMIADRQAGSFSLAVRSIGVE